MSDTVQQQIDSTVAALIATLTTDAGPCPPLSPVPKRIISMYPGQSVAWDDCCNGQLSFQLVSMVPHFTASSAGGRRSLRSPCAVSWWDIQIEVKLLRCTPSVQDGPTIPKPRQITASGNAILTDMGVLLQAIQSRSEIYDLGPWVPVGPEGGCAGGSWTFTMRADAEPCD